MYDRRKVCPCCMRDLPIHMFWRNRSKPSGLESHCKRCRSHKRRLQRVGWDTSVPQMTLRVPSRMPVTAVTTPTGAVLWVLPHMSADKLIIHSDSFNPDFRGRFYAKRLPELGVYWSTRKTYHARTF